MGEIFTDPAYMRPIAPDDGVLELKQLSDDLLGHVEAALHLACGRSKTALNTKHRQYLCFLFRSVKREQARRNALIL